jgi:hypothetical protein
LDPTQKNFAEKTNTEAEVEARYGKEWKNTLEQFFSGKLTLSSSTCEQYFQMNPTKYNELLEQRALNFLNFGMETRKKK